jgi:hypothetical protein
VPVNLAPPRTPFGQVLCSQAGAYSMLGAGHSTSGALGTNCRAMPIWVPEPMVIDRIGLEVTAAGDAGSVIRAGIWKDAGNGALPAAVHLDAGTFPGDVVQQAELVVSNSPNLLSPNVASIETDASGWQSVVAGLTITRSTAAAADGLAALAFTADSNSDAAGMTAVMAATGLSGVPVVGGQTYTALASARAATRGTTGSVFRAQIRWYDAAGGLVSVDDGTTTVADVTTGWVVGAAVRVAPASARFAAVAPRFGGGAGYAAGEVHYVDKIGFFAGSVPIAAWTLQGSGALDVGAYWLGAQIQNFSVTQPSLRICNDRIGAPVAPSAAAGVASAVVGAGFAMTPGPLTAWTGGQSIIGAAPRIAVRAA